MALIDFGVQSSGDEGGDIINKLWNDLLEIFYDDPAMTGYFKTLEDFQIIFRVSGKSTDFEGEGPEYLKGTRRSKTITIDFTIPEAKWRGLTSSEYRAYISSGVRECFELLKERALKLEQVKNLEKLENDFKKGMKEFDGRNCK